MRLAIDMQPLAEALRECSVNLAFAVGFASLCYLTAKLWQWR